MKRGAGGSWRCRGHSQSGSGHWGRMFSSSSHWRHAKVNVFVELVISARAARLVNECHWHLVTMRSESPTREGLLLGDARQREAERDRMTLIAENEDGCLFPILRDNVGNIDGLKNYEQ